MSEQTEQLDEVLAAYLEAEAAGWAPPRAQLARCYPQLSGRIEQFFAARERIDRITAAVTPPPPASSWTVSDTLAPPCAASGAWPLVPGYEILEQVARGGMGVVYKARQLALNRVVALKMILAGAHAGPADRGRFRREAEAIGRLGHAGIVQVYEVGEHGGLPFFAMEFVEGGSLADRLDGTPLPPRQGAELVRRLAEAVQACHDVGVVHRDLKPGNVLLASPAAPAPASPAASAPASPVASAPGGGRAESPGASPGANAAGLAGAEPKLTDFGLAKLLDAQGQTASNAIVGTASYMAPEQAAGQSKSVGPPADVYALGAILYELLTGRPPFKAATTMETLLQVMSDEPVAPRQLQRTTPADLESICLKCLEKDPARRYASARALADDLGRYLRGEPVQARPLGPMRRAWRWCKRNRAVAALLAAVLVTLTAGCIVSGALAVRIANAKRFEQNVASRLLPFLRENPDLLELPPEKVFALLREDFYRLNPDEVQAARRALAKAAVAAPSDAAGAGQGERGADALSSFAPNMFGD